MSEDKKIAGLVIGAMGIVYGDIGTSPLYALKKCFTSHDLPVCSSNILGIISLIFWSLLIVVSFKYVMLLLKADQDGEGGILALSSLCSRIRHKTINKIVIILGILGASLFYGDGVITPAISVLGALEGINVIATGFNNYVPLAAVFLLVILFFAQKNGSAKIGLLFGPVMIVWFSVLALIGLFQIAKTPSILQALNPYWGIRFFIEHGSIGLLTFGAIVLVLTGAEALYADLGHFGKKSISISWHGLVLPSLILNYLGQGALLLQNPKAIENPFYLMAPEGSISALIVLSTLATIIASQSIISGVFSMSWKAIQLGYFPRMRVIHTSSQQIGQVYVPVVNFIMLILTAAIVLHFEDSEKLASAYGTAVTTIMLITTLLAILWARFIKHWSWLKVTLIFTPLLLLDLIFWTSNIVKFFDGGWLPCLITLVIYLVILTWRKGREALNQINLGAKYSLNTFIKHALDKEKNRIPGTAVFMCRSPSRVPTALFIHLRHNKYLHKQMIFLSIVTKPIPRVNQKERIKITTLDKKIYQVTAFYGYSEVPNLHALFEKMRHANIDITLSDATFILSKGVPIASTANYLSGWQEKLFIFLAHNAMSATDFFKIPDHRVMELGIRFRI